MIDYLIYLIIKFISKFFSILSPESALCIGRLLGQVIYVLYPNRKGVAYSNLVLVFGSTKSVYELKRICKKTFINLSQTIIEILRLNMIDKNYIEKYISDTGFQNVKATLKNNKGAVLITAHYNNWELLAIITALKGYPMKVLAREQKPERINNMLNMYRESKGSKVIGKGFETREIIRALRNDQPVGILADQDAGKNGVFIDFLGKPASTPSGPIAFAIKTGAKVLPVFLVRKKGPYHTAAVNPPIEFDKKGNREEVIKRGLEAYSKVLGKYIRKYPSQWLWFHKRWKSTPPTSLLILHDGKAGHLNQSKTIAYQVNEIIKQKYPIFPFKINEVKVEFKNKFCRIFTNLCSNFLTRRMIIDIDWLKLVLTLDCYKKLSGMYTDIVISCGDSLSGLNAIIKKQFDAKNAVIMKPSVVKLKNFNIVIVPEHDKIKLKPNIVKTKGALNLIDEKLMDNSMKKLQSLGYKLQRGKSKIGILIGGDTKNYRLSKETVDEVLSKILDIINKKDLEILLTTSRRTSKNVDMLIKKKLKDKQRCKLLVIANDENISDVVPAILGFSDNIIVTGESISMVSEAISSGKDVIVLNPKAKRNYKHCMTNVKLKHTRFLEKLAKDNYIKLASEDTIKLAIEEVYSKNNRMRKFDNREIIEKCISNLL